MLINLLESLKSYILKHDKWTLVQTTFALVFLIQSYNIIKDLICPTQTNIYLEEKSLDSLPILIKICPQHGFDLDRLQKEGYKSIFKYFLGGIALYDNNTRYGWGGKHNKNVREIFDKVNFAFVKESPTGII